MDEDNVLAHLFRVLSGKSQEQFGWDNRIDPSDIGKIERGGRVWRGWLERMAASVQLTIDEGKELLRQGRAWQRRRQRQGRGAADVFARLGESMPFRTRLFYQRLLRARLPKFPPKAEDRRLAREQAVLLKKLEPHMRIVVLRGIRDLKVWAVSEAAAGASVEAASQDPKEAKEWAELAVELAEQVEGEEGWEKKIRGFARAHLANSLKVYGKLREADAELDKATALWEAGCDPDQLLDPGMLLDIEASLRRVQRRFEDSLTASKKAIAVSRYPARSLIIKGFTLEVMGDYEGAIEALLQAEARIDPEAEPRLWYQQRFNLSVNYSHLGMYAQAGSLVEQVRAVAVQLGDKIFLHRLTWIEGRLAAGLGRREKGLRLLDQARQEFEAHKMWFDVALALTEILAVLLEEGRTAEVKALAPALARVFASQEVHREALAALQLFQEAVEQETATAELARRVLSFLFRARHDPGLRFSS